MKIILFGCGDIYNKYKYKIQDYIKILGIIDNKKELYGTLIDGIKIYNPVEAKNFSYDYIVLMSEAAFEMREQLLRLGYHEEKIIHYLDFFGLFPQEIKKFPGIKKEHLKNRKKLLIVSVALSYTGVPIVALTTAKTAAQIGYIVTILSDEENSRYIQEATNCGIDVLIYETLKNASLRNLSWMDKYDLILVNSLPMIRLAIKLAKKRKVDIWIHESSDEYEHIKFWNKEIKEGIQNEKLRFYVPSQKAADNFVQYYGRKKDVLLLKLGIEDKKEYCDSNRKYFSYGLIGGLIEGKGQDIFLSAVEQLSDHILKKSFFFLAGKKNISIFGKDIIDRASLINNCILLGERTQQEMCELYDILDIVVVASRAETVSMVAIEAMMMGKVCIVSHETGIAEYIEHGKNGFVFPSGNVEKLNELMIWCFENQKNLKNIGKNARKTYEQNFSIHIFQKNLQEILLR